MEAEERRTKWWRWFAWLRPQMNVQLQSKLIQSGVGFCRSTISFANNGLCPSDDICARQFRCHDDPLLPELVALALQSVGGQRAELTGNLLDIAVLYITVSLSHVNQVDYRVQVKIVTYLFWQNVAELQSFAVSLVFHAPVMMGGPFPGQDSWSRSLQRWWPQIRHIQRVPSRESRGRCWSFSKPYSRSPLTVREWPAESPDGQETVKKLLPGQVSKLNTLGFLGKIV